MFTQRIESEIGLDEDFLRQILVVPVVGQRLPHPAKHGGPVATDEDIERPVIPGEDLSNQPCVVQSFHALFLSRLKDFSPRVAERDGGVSPTRTDDQGAGA